MRNTQLSTNNMWRCLINVAPPQQQPVECLQLTHRQLKQQRVILVNLTALIAASGAAQLCLAQPFAYRTSLAGC